MLSNNADSTTEVKKSGVYWIGEEIIWKSIVGYLKKTVSVHLKCCSMAQKKC
jgi:hypothetical protein